MSTLPSRKAVAEANRIALENGKPDCVIGWKTSDERNSKSYIRSIRQARDEVSEMRLIVHGNTCTCFHPTQEDADVDFYNKLIQDMYSDSDSESESESESVTVSDDEKGETVFCDKHKPDNVDSAPKRARVDVDMVSELFKLRDRIGKIILLRDDTGSIMPETASHIADFVTLECVEWANVFGDNSTV